MRKFELFLYINGDYIPISSSETTSDLEFSAYDEKLTENENSQYNLTFSIVTKQYKEDNIQINPLVSFYYIGAKMRLILDGGAKLVEMVISDIAPTTYKLSSVYNITASDEASYMWSRHRVGYSFATKNEEDVIVPQNIFDIGEKVLKDLGLGTTWKITSRSLDPALENFRITLEIENSNPYNVLIEACNTLNAYMEINYLAKTLDFYRKKLVEFSGYRYRPDYSLTGYNGSYSGTEMCTMLHVSGGTDADGNVVSMLPPIPKAIYNYMSTLVFNGSDEDLIDAFANLIPANYNNTNLDFDWDNCFIIESEKMYYKIDNIKIPLLYPNVGLWPITVVSKDPYDRDFTGETAIIIKDGSSNLIYTIEDFIFKKGYKKATITNIKDNSLFAEFFINTYATDKNTTFIDSFSDDDYNDGEYFEYDADYNSYSIDSEKMQLCFRTLSVVEEREYIQHFLQKQKEEIIAYVKMLYNNPNLSNIFLNIDMFFPYMATIQKSHFQSWLNNWRSNNIKLHFHTYDYYQLASSIIALRNQFENYAINVYSSACKVYFDARNNPDVTNSDQLFTDIKNALSALQSMIRSSNYAEYIKQMGADNTLAITETDDYFKFLLENKEQQLHNYRQQLEKAIAANDNASASYYDKKYQTLQNLCFGWSGFKGAYQLLVDETTEISSSGTTSVAYQYNRAHNTQQEQLQLLYQEFGQYIYEQEYSNAEELDSISLFNQAYTQFVDMNRIQSSHSLEILDLGTLEQIEIPRLAIGSTIKVYNPDNPIAQLYSYEIGQIDNYTKLYEYAKHFNHLENIAKYHREINRWKNIVINDYKRINNKELSYEEILEKIYNEDLFVTGITRVLREPIKDSVTVEQTSRYKTILSKLIKSI